MAEDCSKDSKSLIAKFPAADILQLTFRSSDTETISGFNLTGDVTGNANISETLEK